MIVPLALVAYGLLTFENQTRLHRVSILSTFAALIWFIFGRNHTPDVTEAEVAHAVFSAVEIGLFIVYALSLVSVLGFAGLFDLIQRVVYRGMISDQQLFERLGWVCFFGSALVDNVTITIVMVTIASLLFLGVTGKVNKEYVTACLGFVLFANAGGVFSFLGDVTSIMIWESGKIATHELFYMTFPSALTAAVVGSRYFRKRLDSTPRPAKQISNGSSSMVDLAVIVLGLLSLVSCPLIWKYAGHVPPFFGLMFAYGITSGLYHFAHESHRRRLAKAMGSTDPHTLELPQLAEQADSHLERSLEKSLERVELATFLVIVPIILIVDGVGATGAFKDLSAVVFGDNPTGLRLIGATYLLGLMSAFIDNVPLTAVALEIMPSENPWHWAFLTFSVAMGGPIMLLGSLPGIIILGKLGDNMSYLRYAKEAGIANFAAFTAGFAVLVLNYSLFNFVL